MNSLFTYQLWPNTEEDVLIKKLFLSHDPDGRHFDSEQLLRAMENIMCYASASEELVSDIHNDAIAKNYESNIEVVGSNEPLGHTIYKLSRQILCKWSGEGNLHTRTMIIFDLLGNYRWDAKVVLVLAAFATSYGEFWLTMQLYPQNPLAVSVATLKQLPSNLSSSMPRFNALRLLVKTLVDMAKCIIKFEGLPITLVMLDNEMISTTKSCIFIASYWITRSSLICSSHIKDLIAMKSEQHSHSTAVAAWELSSLVYKLSRICSHLRGQVDSCHREIETRMLNKLIELFKESHTDNQEVLQMLFSLKNDFPIKNCSTQAKQRVSELKDKIVILLVSKPELLPLEELRLLVQQTYDHPLNKKLEGSYEVVWVPLSFSDTWTDAEERSFDFLSRSLPWYSVRQPQSLNSAVVNFIKQEWNFKDMPIMVVMDSQGMVTNMNALDMVLIWGLRGYPFSVAKEIELWEDEKWTLQLMVEEIDPLLTKRVEEGRNICIYGSNDLEWIREFNSKMKEIKRNGLQLDMVYVGKKNQSEQVRTILATINEDLHSSLLSFTKVQFFWFRLESMRRSKLRLGNMVDTHDHVLNEVSALLAIDDNWAVFGKGSSQDIVWLLGRKLMECLNQFPVWGENVAKLGFIGAIRNELEPIDLNATCSHSNVISYAEGSIEGICENCKRTMKKIVIYE